MRIYRKSSNWNVWKVWMQNVTNVRQEIGIFLKIRKLSENLKVWQLEGKVRSFENPKIVKIWKFSESRNLKIWRKFGNLKIWRSENWKIWKNLTTREFWIFRPGRLKIQRFDDENNLRALKFKKKNRTLRGHKYRSLVENSMVLHNHFLASIEVTGRFPAFSTF